MLKGIKSRYSLAIPSNNYAETMVSGLYPSGSTAQLSGITLEQGYIFAPYIIQPSTGVVIMELPEWMKAEMAREVLRKKIHKVWQLKK